MAIKKTGRLFYPPFFCRISYMTIATVGDWVLAVDFITSKAYISGIIEREREKMDKKKDLIQMLEKIQNPNHLAMVYGFVKRMYLEEQKEREKKHE